MLSALISSWLSYPAMLLAEQLVDQRSVPPGPLVKCSSHFCGFRLYLCPSRSAGLGHRHIIRVLCSYPSDACRRSRYGVASAATSHGIALLIIWSSSILYHEMRGPQNSRNLCNQINVKEDFILFSTFARFAGSVNEGSTVISRIFITDYSVK